jgi:hypothetical protein
MNGKGDKARPLSIPRTQFEANWDLIFRKQQQQIKESNESELRKHSFTRRRGNPQSR